MPPDIYAAGGVLYRPSAPDQYEFLVVHRPKYDDWSIPKGKLDAGETLEEAAVREVHEETGHEPRIERLLGTVAYDTSSGLTKIARYWLMKAQNGSFAPSREVDEALWLSPKRARKLLTYHRDRQIAQYALGVLARPEAGRVFLARHASAGDREQFDGPDADRPVSLTGMRQVRGMVEILSEFPLARLVTSPLRRCVDSLAPLAERIDTPLESDDALTEGADLTGARALVGRLTGEWAALCTHGGVVTALIEDAYASGADLDEPSRHEKGSIWQLEIEAGRIVSGRYRPPRTRP